MDNKMKLIIDTSSVIWMSLLAGKSEEFGYTVPFEDKMVNVNGWQYGYDNAVNHIVSVMKKFGMNPNHAIFVVEGSHSKARRVQMYPDYKASRGSRPPQAYDEFHRCKDKLTGEFRKAGSAVVTNDYCEADDVIAYLVNKFKADTDVVVLTNDGDLSTLIEANVSLYRLKGHLTENPYGPFKPKYIPIYKALVGDTSDNIKGAPGFGDKAFLELLRWGGEGVLPALEGVITRKELHTLEDDIHECKPIKKLIDGADSVYTSYEVGSLHPEWVHIPLFPLLVQTGSRANDEVEDDRIRPMGGMPKGKDNEWVKSLRPAEYDGEKHHCVFDCELIGDRNPVFLVCFKVIETGETKSFWWHEPFAMAKMEQFLYRPDLTFISFNGIGFDAPLMSAAVGGKSPYVLKEMAQKIIQEGVKPWTLPGEYGYEPLEFDHIDLMEVSPGTQISLKTFAGRMSYPTMVDLPFEHDKDLNEEERVVLERYCQNDLGVTAALFEQLRNPIKLRKSMSDEYGIDLRSKSDAQVAEAVLKKVADIKRKGLDIPEHVKYKAPPFIQTNSDELQQIIQQIEAVEFKVNEKTGAVVMPEFLESEISLCSGTYQMGIGGLHSTHDKGLYVKADGDKVCLLDADVGSFYPFLMLLCGLTPDIANGGGERFLAEYRKIVEDRIRDKRRMQEVEREIASIEKTIAEYEALNNRGATS